MIGASHSEQIISTASVQNVDTHIYDRVIGVLLVLMTLGSVFASFAFLRGSWAFYPAMFFSLIVPLLFTAAMRRMISKLVSRRAAKANADYAEMMELQKSRQMAEARSSGAFEKWEAKE